jgi:hypothetical protein
MDNEKILKFAKKDGYATVNYLGKYKEFDLYKPLYEDPDVATGLPVYIIVKDDKPEFVRGKEGLEIQKYRVKQKKMVKSDN